MISFRFLLPFYRDARSTSTMATAILVWLVGLAQIIGIVYSLTCFACWTWCARRCMALQIYTSLGQHIRCASSNLCVCFGNGNPNETDTSHHHSPSKCQWLNKMPHRFATDKELALTSSHDWLHHKYERRWMVTIRKVTTTMMMTLLSLSYVE